MGEGESLIIVLVVLGGLVLAVLQNANSGDKVQADTK